VCEERLLQEVAVLLCPAELVLIMDTAVLEAGENLSAKAPDLLLRRTEHIPEHAPGIGHPDFGIEPILFTGGDETTCPGLGLPLAMRTSLIHLDQVEECRISSGTRSASLAQTAKRMSPSVKRNFPASLD
jgi:hypothetical protein